MTTVTTSVLRSRCLSLMDEVVRRGTVVIITKRGKPVAELRPVKAGRARSIIGLHRGRIRIRGDIIAPLGEPWNVLQ